MGHQILTAISALRRTSSINSALVSDGCDLDDAIFDEERLGGKSCHSQKLCKGRNYFKSSFLTVSQDLSPINDWMG
jgi:hypothetical protein